MKMYYSICKIVEKNKIKIVFDNKREKKEKREIDYEI